MKFIVTQRIEKLHGRNEMKYLSLIIGAMVLLCNCAGSEVKRGVQDNVFYSSSKPEISILINPDFKFGGSRIVSGEAGTAKIEIRTLDMKKEYYPFFNREKNRVIEIFLNELTTRNSSFLPNPFKKMEYKIDEDKVNINGNRYDYCVAVFEKSSGACYLTKILSRIIPPNNNCRITISYSRKIDHYLLCDKWKDNHLTESEMVILKDFLADSEKDIRIIDYQAPISKTLVPE
jgi:hypothetical protein